MTGAVLAPRLTVKIFITGYFLSLCPPIVHSSGIEFSIVRKLIWPAMSPAIMIGGLAPGITVIVVIRASCLRSFLSCTCGDCRISEAFVSRTCKIPRLSPEIRFPWNSNREVTGL